MARTLPISPDQQFTDHCNVHISAQNKLSWKYTHQATEHFRHPVHKQS